LTSLGSAGGVLAGRAAEVSGRQGAELPKVKCSAPVSSSTTPNSVYFAQHPMSWSTAWLSPRVLPPREYSPDVHRSLAVHAQSHDRTAFGWLILVLGLVRAGLTRSPWSRMASKRCLISSLRWWELQKPWASVWRS